MSFSSFNFNPTIQTALKVQGFESPTPIQEQAIPHVLQGHDVMGLAQTGTGKTAAFVLPILERLSKSKDKSVRALVIAPTRELAQQIHEVICDFGSRLGIRSTTVFGGVSMDRQIRDLRHGVDIVVACPGRLLDHMQQRTVQLSKLEILVLDEADQMFDMGFAPTIRRILQQLPRQRQTLMFSATMPPEIRRLAQEALQNPVTVQVGQSAPATTVSHALYPVQAHLKTKLLTKLLEHTDTESVLVFTRTKHRAKSVARQLGEQGFKVTSLQGNLSQGQRKAAMSGFRDGTYQIMVATDIAARGIDISSISHVINYDIPDTVEAYTHRIGRTGRAAKTGDALTMIDPEDTAMVRSIERVLKMTLERRTLSDFDYNARKPQGQDQGNFRRRGARSEQQPQRRHAQDDRFSRNDRGGQRRWDRPSRRHSSGERRQSSAGYSPLA